MKSILLIIAAFPMMASADITGSSNGSVDPGYKGPAAKGEKGAGEYGGDLALVSSTNKSFHKMTNPNGERSWRKTQVLLKGMKNIRCRIGGKDAASIAIPALANEGYCNKKAEVTGTTKLPRGTVWVYNHEPHGNSVVKVKEGIYYSNRKMSAPPPDHGDLVAIMVPGCGKKAKKCQTADAIAREMKKLEEASDKVKSERAEAGERLEVGSQSKTKSLESEEEEQLAPSKILLQAEASCKYETALEDMDKYAACVQKITGDDF
jgi:hypothetical protein